MRWVTVGNGSYQLRKLDARETDARGYVWWRESEGSGHLTRFYVYEEDELLLEGELVPSIFCGYGVTVGVSVPEALNLRPRCSVCGKA